MMRQFSTIIGLAMVSVLAAAPAHAIKLEIFAPRIEVSQGWGFKDGVNGQGLQPGNSVRAVDGGSGQVVYDDGCADPVQGPTVVSVQEQSPCAAGTVGEGHHVPPGVHDYLIYALPGAAVIGGLFFLFDEDDKPKIDKPASP